jgi:hypothetical protein
VREGGQVWRIFTSLFFVSSKFLNVFAEYGPLLLAVRTMEKRMRLRSSLSFVLLMLLAAVHAFARLLSFTEVGTAFWFGAALIASRLFPDDADMRTLRIPMRLLPWVQAAAIFSVNRLGLAILGGIWAAHIVFYLLFVLPVALGVSIFTTPTVLKWIWREL